MRLDKIFSTMGILSRSEIKKEIKKGLISVNDVIVKSTDININTDNDIIKYYDKEIKYEEYVYYILNKPQDTVTARKDNINKTVLELLDDKRPDLSPVGRLDKDTTGLLLITNDGKFSHELMSPKKHVSKTYYAEIKGKVTQEDVIKFQEGVDIGDEKLTLPAKLKILSSDEISKIEITIYEGRYHQVKRMFESVEKEVILLERISIGNLKLDSNIKCGEYRKVTKEYLERNIYDLGVDLSEK